MLGLRRYFAGILFVICSGWAAADAPLQVLTSVKPLQLLAIAVGGSDVHVDALLDPRGSPHDYQLRPSDRSKLDAADVVFWVGPRLEHFMQPALKVLSDRVAQVALDDAGVDPHLWMDPVAMQVAAQRMADTYAQLRPARAQVFYANAAHVKAELQQQDAKFRTLFAQLPSRGNYMVEHDAYARFEIRYGLQHAAALTDSSDLPPSVAVMLRIRGLLDSGQVSCVLAEFNQSAQLRALLDKRSIRVVRLDAMAAEVAVDEEGLLNFYRQFGEAVLTCLKR